MRQRRPDVAARTVVGRGGSEADEATCSVRVTTMPVEESLARVVGVLRRTRWSVRELHHRGDPDCHEMELRATKRDGRADVLMAQLQREVVVIDVEPVPDGVGRSEAFDEGTGRRDPR